MMYYPEIIGLVVCVLGMLITVSLTQRDIYFKINVDFNDKLCEQSRRVFEKNKLSRITCAGICQRDTSCTGFTFRHTDGGTCTGCNVTPSLVSTDIQYFDPIYKWGLPCTEVEGCDDDNQQCIDGTCICRAGYSFHRASWSCVQSCTEYGSTFHGYPGTVIAYRDYTKFPSDLANCKQTCVAMDDCKSIEYTNYWNYCHINKFTALDFLDHYGKNTNYDYYNRDCAN